MLSPLRCDRFRRPASCQVDAARAHAETADVVRHTCLRAASCRLRSCQMSQSRVWYARPNELSRSPGAITWWQAGTAVAAEGEKAAERVGFEPTRLAPTSFPVTRPRPTRRPLRERRGWDSNPRGACTPSCFRDSRTRPLCDPSSVGDYTRGRRVPQGKGCTPQLLSGGVRRVNTQYGSLLHPGHTGLFCRAVLVEGAVWKVPGGWQRW